MDDLNVHGGERSLSVIIAGENVKVHAEEGIEYITRMANYINYIVNEFNAKKGHSVRQSLLLTYACLELCDALFRERESKMTASDRNYEKMFQMEVFAHKKTQDLLDTSQKQLTETEKELAQVRKDLEDFINAFDKEKEKGKDKEEKK